MRSTLIASLLTLLLTLAGAVEAASCSQSVRLGNDLILAGDSDRRVIEAGPDRTVSLETREGGAAGYRHDFYRRGVTVQVYVRAGVVTAICRVRG